MATKRSIWVLFGILVISAWVFGSAIQAGAETMNFKIYNWQTKDENVPLGDVAGHAVGVELRSAFYVLEDGEVALTRIVSSYDLVKVAGPYKNYITMNFADGSIIIIKGEGTSGEAAAAFKTEIIKGTGRFEGIKGTLTGKLKFLPAEPGETRGKGIGEGTITYTLPSK